MSFTGKSYSQIQTASSKTVVEDNKKKTSLLKDNSWIKRNVDDDEPVEQVTNFGKSVLSRYKSNENLDSAKDTTSKTESKTTTVTTSGSGVQALTKRFGGSQDKLNETRTTTTRTSVKTQPKTSTTSTTTVKDAAKITETVTTTKKDVVKSSTKSETTPARVLPDIKPRISSKKPEITVKPSKDIIDGSTSSVKTTTSIKTFKEEVSPTKTTSYSVQSTKSDKPEVITVKSSKDTFVGPTSPVKTTTSIKTYTTEDVSPTKTTSYSLKSTKSTEDQLFDTLIPTSIKTTNTKPNSSDYKSEVITVKSSSDTVIGSTSSVKTITSTKTVIKEDVSPTKTTSYSVLSTKSDYKPEVTTVSQRTIVSSKDTIDGPTSPVKTTTSIKTYTTEDVSPIKTTSYSLKSTKSTEDQLFDTLIPTSITTTNTRSSSSREDQDFTVSKSIRTVYSSNSSNDRYEWGSVTSPSYTTRTSYTESRPVDYLSDTITSKSSSTVYTSPERKVSERDLCTYCRKNMHTDEKIILDDMNINCHASCFKCEVCHTSLGHLKAGDSLWVYRSAVHCESCFGVTKGKWHR